MILINVISMQNLMVRTKLCPSSRVTWSSLNQSIFAAILNPLLLDDLDHTIPVHIEREMENLALFLRLNMQNCYSSFYHISRNDRMSRTTNDEIERQEEERDEVSEHLPDAGASDRGTCDSWTLAHENRCIAREADRLSARQLVVQSKRCSEILMLSISIFNDNLEVESWNCCR